MQITINGKPRELERPMALHELLQELSLNAQHLAVEVNLELVPRSKHSEYELQPGDALEIVTLAGGG